MNPLTLAKLKVDRNSAFLNESSVLIALKMEVLLHFQVEEAIAVLHAHQAKEKNATKLSLAPIAVHE